MLDFIRSNAQSWGVKIAFGLIIIVFIFWGVGSLTKNPEVEVISVNGQAITMQELQKRCNEIEQNIRQNFPKITDAELTKFRIKQLAAQQLILETLVLQEANRISIMITPIELRQTIESFPVFHNKEGKFDPETYLQFLKSQNETPGRFENQLRTNLLINKLQQELTAGAYIPPNEAYDVYSYESALRSIKYILFPTDAYLDKVTISPEEVANIYEESLDSFKIPAQLNLEYLPITPQSLAHNQHIDTDAVADYYEKHIERYTHPEQIHAQHIVIFAPENSTPEIAEKAKKHIEHIATLLKNGEKFSDVARKHSQDNFAQNGGDVGWFSYEQALPAFSSVAFSLKPGQISEPIQTPVGYHIIKVLEKKSAETLPLKEVSKDIHQQLAEIKAAEKLQDTLEHVQLALIDGKNLSEAGELYTITPITTGLIPSTTVAKQLDLSNVEDVSVLLNATPETIIDNPLSTKTGYVFIRITDNKPESTKPLELVENQISNRLKTLKANELAMKDAEKQLANLKNSTIPKDLEKKVQISSPTMRSATLEGLNNPQLVPDIFKAEPGTWLTKPYPINQGAIIAYVSETVTHPSQEQWATIKDTFISAILKSKQDQMFKGFLAMLEKQAKLSIKNELIVN